MNHTLSRTGLYFFAACFLAWSLFSPGGAMAANTTINDNTSGPYTGLYGNDGTATTPTADTYASGNMLVLGNGYTGPTITDTSVVTVAGGYAPGNSNGDSSSNTLTINSGTSFTATGFTNIYGGRVAAGSGNAAGNTVTMGDFTQGSGNVVVYGGRAHGSGNASTNGVTIGSGNTNDFSGIYGAYANSGNAISNTVTINGGGQIAFVNGGYSADGNAGGSGVGNVVNISGGNANILNGIGGGNSNSGSSGSASYNEVNIGSGYTGTIGGNVHGGWVSGGSGNAEHNSVTIAGGTLQGGAAVIGGHSTNGAATDNTVSISGGRVAGDIRGGSTTTGSATGNTVSITTTGETYLNIYGGYGGGSGDLFTGNTLNLAAGNAVSSVHNTAVLNFTSGGSAGINTLDTTATGAVGSPKMTLNTYTHAVDFGGVINGTGGIDKTGAGTLTLSGTNTYSGGTTVSAGTLAGNIASGTDLTVASGATYDGSGAARSVGALADAGSIINTHGLTAQSGSFSGVISGAGGLTKTGAGTLTLSGTNTFTGSLSIDAGGLTLGAGGSLATNSLSLATNTVFDYSAASYAFHNLTVRGLNTHIVPSAAGADFSGANLAYIVPQTAANGATLLTVQGGATIDAATAVSLAYASGRPNINAGEGFTLLNATTLTDSGFTQLTVQTPSGDIYTLNVSGTQLLAVLQQLSPTGPAYERLKAYAESRAASLAFANQGLDFILNRGFGSALATTAGPGFRFGSFGGLGGGWSRYTTGSHVDVSGLSLLAGLALGNDLAPGRLTLGAFFEGGWGNYNSHNSFSNAASVDGKGDSSYYGGGILGRYDLTEGALSGLYFDASARLGRTETDFRSGDIRYNGWNANFESSSLYYGLHGGFGYVWSFTDQAALDLSAKLLWTRQKGDSLTVYQDRLRFKDADSLRTRLGGRFAYSVNDYVSPYLGAYWEHEFDGQQRIAVNGQRLSSPSLKGDTGLAELGLSLKPSPSLPLSFDLGVQGYVGTREGVAGSLQIKLEF